MNYSLLLKFSADYLRFKNGETEYLKFTVVPKKNIMSRSDKLVYIEGKVTVVRINRFKGEKSKLQIYRAVGHHVGGNSQKSYENIDLLLEDFEIQQDQYLAIREKKE